MRHEEDKDIALISAYFNMELSDTDVAHFENQWKSNSSFAEKVEEYKISMDIVENKIPDTQREIRLKRWKKQFSELETQKTKSRSWIPLAVGIAALFIICITIHFTIGRTSDSQKIAQLGWDKRVGMDFVVRSEANTSNTKVLLESLSAYDLKDYNHALELVNAYDNTFIRYHDVLVMRIISQFQLNNTDEALKLTDTLATYNPPVSRWYKGLIYLSLDDIENAKLYLQVPKTEYGELKLK